MNTEARTAILRDTVAEAVILCKQLDDKIDEVKAVAELTQVWLISGYGVTASGELEALAQTLCVMQELAE